MSDCQKLNDGMVYFYGTFTVSSFLGQIFLLYLHYHHPSRNTPSQRILLRMIICDLIFAFSTLIDLYPRCQPSVRCIFQSWLRQFSVLCLFINAFFLSYFSYKCLVLRQNVKRKEELISLVISIVVPICTSSTVVGLGLTKPTQYACLFAGGKNHGDLLVLCLFYIPIGVLTFASFVVVQMSLKQFRQLSKEFSQTDKIAGEQILKNMMYYPLIFFFCWAGFFSYRITVMICNCKPHFFKFGIMITFFSTQGILTGLVYSYNYWNMKKIYIKFSETKSIGDSDLKKSRNSESMIEIASFEQAKEE